LKILLKTFAALLVLGISPLYSQAQNIEDEEARDIQTLMHTLDADIVAFQFLLGKIDSAEKSDREQLFYRQDQRVFKILADYDTLASQVAGLPEGSPQRVAVTQQLAEIGRDTVSDTDSALFDRIDDIQRHIVESNTRLTELSGTALLATRAYVHTMESIRVEYYEALANHVESRNRLGLPSKKTA